MNKQSTFKDKILLNLSFLNILFIISSINSYEIIKSSIKNDSFTDKILYLIGFSFIPILISTICLIISKTRENKYKKFGFYISILTILTFFIESLIAILN